MCPAQFDSFALIAFLTPGPGEMLLLALVALLLYGGELPQVARAWGKSFAELRRSLSGIQRDLNDVIYSEPERRLEYHPPRSPYRDDSVVEPADAGPPASAGGPSETGTLGSVADADQRD